MSEAFIVPEIAAIYSTIEDLFYMTEPQPIISTSFGKDEDGCEFIKFSFRLRNGNSEIKIYEDTGTLSYISWGGESLHSIGFDDTEFESINGSFCQAFKGIITFDRQQANTTKITNTSVDRASFGLVEVN